MGGIEEWGYWKKHQDIKHCGGTLKSDIHLVWLKYCLLKRYVLITHINILSVPIRCWHCCKYLTYMNSFISSSQP